MINSSLLDFGGDYAYLCARTINHIMGLVNIIRDTWRESLDVKEADDLPYVLLTEVINQSIIRGATVIEVSYDGRSISVKDNAAPFEESLESLLNDGLGMMNEEARRLYRLTDRQWGRNPYTVINALCHNFTLVSGGNDRMRTVICEDGEIVSSSDVRVSIGRHNVVTFVPFLFMEAVSPGFMGRLFDYIAPKFPQLTILYNSSIQEAEEAE